MPPAAVPDTLVSDTVAVPGTLSDVTSKVKAPDESVICSLVASVDGSRSGVAMAPMSMETRIKAPVETTFPYRSRTGAEVTVATLIPSAVIVSGVTDAVMTPAGVSGSMVTGEPRPVGVPACVVARTRITSAIVSVTVAENTPFWSRTGVVAKAPPVPGSSVRSTKAKILRI